MGWSTQWPVLSHASGLQSGSVSAEPQSVPVAACATSVQLPALSHTSGLHTGSAMPAPQAVPGAAGAHVPRLPATSHRLHSPPQSAAPQHTLSTQNVLRHSPPFTQGSPATLVPWHKLSAPQ